MADCKPTERHELFQFRQALEGAVIPAMQGGAE
jgi:hypothetical protein